MREVAVAGRTQAWDHESAQRRAAARGSQGLRRLFAVEHSERIVAFAQSTLGRSVLFVLFALCLKRVGQTAWLPLTVGAAVCAFCVRYRAYALAATTMAMLGLNTAWFGRDTVLHILVQEGLQNRVPHWALNVCALVAFFAFALSYLLLAQRYPASFAARRPVLSMLGLMAALTVVGLLPLVRGVALAGLWAFIAVFAAYVWFLAYALSDQRLRDRSPVPAQLGTFNPFWSFSSASPTPFGKGAAYLRKVQAKTPQELAVSQLKGLKLLLWSVVLNNFRKGLVWLVSIKLQLPLLSDVQTAHAAGRPYSVLVAWGCLVWATVDAALMLAIMGHRIVAVARMAGFRLQRNTWRPLEARSLADFWNRYYFYFKELLVEFFFYPTFLRVFRKHPRLRVFAATFAAAGIGNATYHFFRDIGLMLTMGPRRAFVSYESYLFYCLVLATGIGISQARSGRSRAASRSFPGRIWSFCCVWSFIVCLHIFGNESRDYSLGTRLSFMASLFGVHQ